MRTVFGLFACVTLFTPCEAVARSLQGTTALGSMEAGKLLTKQYAERYGLKPPHPVCSSKTPAHFRYTQEEDANDQECSEVEGKCLEMFEALDLVRSEVERRFDQVGIQAAAGREQAIIEAAQGKKVNGVKLTQFGMLCPFSKPCNHKPVPCCQRWKNSSNYACACPYLLLHQSAPSRLCAG
ncbi:hypothetical protein ABG768_021701 [Culter alburnus]|uniref:Uncharacterized protein n=1 Tax=Culter alburnus TaxID=194366 RepID=A0AAW2AU98_CULAL